MFDLVTLNRPMYTGILFEIESNVRFSSVFLVVSKAEWKLDPAGAPRVQHLCLRSCQVLLSCLSFELTLVPCDYGMSSTPYNQGSVLSGLF